MSKNGLSLCFWASIFCLLMCMACSLSIWRTFWLFSSCLFLCSMNFLSLSSLFNDNGRLRLMLFGEGFSHTICAFISGSMTRYGSNWSSTCKSEPAYSELQTLIKRRWLYRRYFRFSRIYFKPWELWATLWNREQPLFWATEDDFYFKLYLDFPDFIISLKMASLMFTFEKAALQLFLFKRLAFFFFGGMREW